MDVRYRKIATLRAIFGDVNVSHDGINVACMCPNSACSSRRKRKLKLAIRLDYGLYHCWVCGVKGSNICELVKRYNISVPSEKIDELHNLFSRHIYRRIDDECIDQDVTVTLPDGFTLIATATSSEKRSPSYKSVYRYMISRGYTYDDMCRFRIGFTTSDEYAYRVVIPSFDANGDLNFYMSRATMGWMYPKYKNVNVKKHAVIFNEIDVDWTSELIVTEGAFDALNTGLNATCLLGNTLPRSSALFKMIVKHSTPVILALDNTETINTNKIAKQLYSYDIPVKVFDMSGYKDLGEMPRDIIHDRVKTSRVWTPKTSLRQRITSISL